MVNMLKLVKKDVDVFHDNEYYVNVSTYIINSFKKDV
jgi:hypothetical protein